jgi:GTP-binding protein
MRRKALLFTALSLRACCGFLQSSSAAPPHRRRRTELGFIATATTRHRQTLPQDCRNRCFLTTRQRQPWQLRVNVAAALVRRSNRTDAPQSASDADTGGALDKDRMSRPERKALERQKKSARRKNANHRKHNYSERKADELARMVSDGEGRYELHSTGVAALNGTSTPDDVMRAIKRAQNLHDDHDLLSIGRFLFEQTDASFAYGYRGSILSRLAVAALHANNHELARKAIDERQREHRLSMLPMESAALIRGLLRVHNVTDALRILDDELALPVGSTGDDDATAAAATVGSDPLKRDVLKHRALSIASIASRYFFEGEPSMALLACQKLSDLAPVVRQAGLSAADLRMPWVRILSGAAECESKRRDGTVFACEGAQGGNAPLPLNLVYSVLNAFLSFPVENDDRVYEILSNSLVRRVVFVTGAISMASCPESDGRGEAVFIGRSNAGKSSLINMLTNRKSLAFTSKRPGKTRQFNFFAVNDKPGLEKVVRYGDDVPGTKDPDSFYLVDVPGIGYAKVPDSVKNEWSSFLMQYLSTRQTLKCVFHLIDSRLGPTEDDERIMRQMSESLIASAVYVVVLTKADKNVKSASSQRNPGKVSRNVLEAVDRSLVDAGLLSNPRRRQSRVPVIASSSETKLGRDEIWRYLRLAAEG